MRNFISEDDIEQAILTKLILCRLEMTYCVAFAHREGEELEV